MEKLNMQWHNRGDGTPTPYDAPTTQKICDKIDELVDDSNAMQKFIGNSNVGTINFFSNGYTPSLTIPNVTSSSHIILFTDTNGFAVIWKNGGTYNSHAFAEHGSIKIKDYFDITFTNPKGDGYTGDITIKSKDSSSHIISAIYIKL